jgi:hypothetical protein
METKEFEFNSGCLIDNRPESEKIKDFHFKEFVASAAPVEWKEKPESEWRKFPDLNQGISNSCVMATIDKLGLVMLWLKEKTFVLFSRAFYQMRSNKPSGGMIGVEAFEIWRKNGLPLEQLVPSEKMSDAELDAIQIEQYEKYIAKVFAISGHVGLDNGDFETLASVIQVTGKAVMAWFYFTTEEWSKYIPTVSGKINFGTALRHSVAVVDFFLVGGKKYLLIEDSAWFGGLTRRLISEEFFRERNWFIRYPTNFKFQDQTIIPESIKPVYKFKNIVRYGMENNPDVRALQDILKYEGFFPIERDSTGNYFAMTTAGVLKFQLKYNVATPDELHQLQGRQAGPKTLAKLNELYS